MDYCTHCGRGGFGEKGLRELRKDEGFLNWCGIKRIHGSKGLDPKKATEEDAKAYFDWHKAWADMGVPG